MMARVWLLDAEGLVQLRLYVLDYEHTARGLELMLLCMPQEQQRVLADCTRVALESNMKVVYDVEGLQLEVVNGPTITRLLWRANAGAETDDGA